MRIREEPTYGVRPSSGFDGTETFDMNMIGNLIGQMSTPAAVLENIAQRPDLNPQHQEGLILHPNTTKKVLRILSTKVHPSQKKRLDKRLSLFDPAPVDQYSTEEQNQSDTLQPDYSDYSDYSDDWNDTYGHR